MSDHFIEKCEKCEKVVSQCRCMSPNKTIRWTICDECRRKTLRPNEKTLRAMKDLESGKGKTYNSAEELIRDLKSK